MSGRKYLRDYQPIFEKKKLIGHLWIYKRIGHLEVKNFKVSKETIIENLVNNIPADIAIFDTDHRYLYLNKTAIVNDKFREWIIGKDDFEYCDYRGKDTKDAIIRREIFDNVLATKTEQQFEELNYDKNQQPVYSLRQFKPVLDPTNQIQYVIGYGINITNIKLKEITLNKRYDVIRELFNSIDTLIFIVNSQSSTIFVDHRWKELIGIDILSINDPSFIKSITSGADLLLDDIHNFISHSDIKYSRNSIIEIKSISGELRNYKYYFAKYQQNSENDCDVAIFFTNITDQIKVQNELLLISERAKELSDKKSSFISMMSHELRTPLSVILSSSEIMSLLISKENLALHLTPYLERIERQVERMTILMNDFLMVSKLEMGKINLKIVKVNLVETLMSLIQDQHFKFPNIKSVEFEQRGIAYKVDFDQKALIQILDNLMSNAIKYSIKDNKLPKFRLRFCKHYWSIIVADYGIGIDPELLEKIGEPFLRGKNVENIPGTGLGLNIIKMFTKLHDGTFLVKSQQFKGSVFQLQFKNKT